MSYSFSSTGGGSGVTDGDKGDITVSSSGATWVIDAGAVTLAKMADMATASVIYRKSSGAGPPEVQALATLKTDLGLTGTNSGDQTITLTGNVTGSGTGSFATTIAANVVADTMLRDSAALSVIGRSANSTGDPGDIAAANDGEVLRRSGTTVGFGTIATAGIADGAVTLAKQANMATASVVYRKTTGSGAPEVQSLATLKTDLGLTGTNSGDQTLPTRASLGLDTGDSPQFAGINLGHASDTTLTRDAAGELAIEGNRAYRAGGNDVAMADGGTGASLSDPNADRILFWDDSAGTVTWLALGTNLTITGTTLDAAGGGSSVYQAPYVVNYASTANFANTGPTNTVLTASAVGITSIDGNNLVLDDKVLLNAQTTGSQKGVYSVTTEGTASVATVLTRVPEFDTWAEIATQPLITVLKGTVNGDDLWMGTNNPGGTLGTTNVTFKKLISTTDIDATITVNASNQLSVAHVPNAVTFNTTGGAAAGTTFDGSAARTIDYSSVGAAAAGAIQDSGLTTSTARILGRTTASAGAIEQLTVGATLSLTAGSLSVASVPNSLTFNTSGGVAAGTTYNGATARTVDYSSVGAAPLAPRVQAVTSAATVTPTFSDDMVKITAQAAALNLANPTGTAEPGHGTVIRIKDNGTARAITYGTQYRAMGAGITLPTTTVVNKTLYLGMIYNADDTKWDVVSVNQEQ